MSTEAIEEQERQRDNDLKLRRRKPDEVDLGGVVEPDDDGTEDRR